MNMAEPSNSNNIAENESGQLGGCKGGAPPNANPNLSPVALKTLISCFPDQKLQSVSAPSQGVSALQPSQSPSPSMACQQQLMNPSLVTSLLLLLLGMSSSQVQQPSSLTAHVPQKTKWSITRCEFVEFDSLLPENSCLNKSDLKAVLSTCISFEFRGQTSQCSHTLLQEKTHIDSIDRWLSAFAVYCTVLLSSFLHRAGEMFAFKEIIRLAHCKLTGFAWLSYDIDFLRKAAGNLALNWGEWKIYNCTS